MTYDGGLPYEECRRAQRLAPRRDRDRAPLSPGYALPPFHPAHPPKPVPRHRALPRRRHRRLDGAAVSGLLTVLCVATLLVTITVAF
ncbi:hypothetical protein ACFY1G_14780 [Streptomyces olivaceus]|uniref:hypothetical protein n=1 Tax=Streptomyces olivaceus TaxID=47716 RepID=UPI0004C9BFDC|nr:hypothetical protein [Streptomyces olivaceus]MBZ6083545.1 hypothetical protein [Streptomyces olivaceus]MBZ6105803.1 hypothetical protein [Streptomyces olivaceus]MBZ6210986.1 hypothetical protein [Streptomyces olivaceus]